MSNSWHTKLINYFSSSNYYYNWFSFLTNNFGEKRNSLNIPHPMSRSKGSLKLTIPRQIQKKENKEPCNPPLAPSSRGGIFPFSEIRTMHRTPRVQAWSVIFPIQRIPEFKLCYILRAKKELWGFQIVNSWKIVLVHLPVFSMSLSLSCTAVSALLGN